MTGRKCSTCKHYEAAPIWRKGWCRNPLLYSPQQSHLVSEEDLDCERGMGNYWEPSSLLEMSNEPPPSSQPISRETPVTPSVPVTTSAGIPVYPVSGSSGYGGDAPVEPPPTGGRGGSSGGGGGPLNYYSEERYWTDYLRIAAPILGVLLMVVLFWLWAQSFLGDDDSGGTTGVATGTASSLPTIGPSVTAGGTHPAGAGTPTSPIVISSVTAPAGATNTPVIIVEATPTTEGETPSGGSDIYAGATVEIANTGGTGANLRTEANTTSEIITTLLDGTQLTTTGDSVDADGLTWWPVTGPDGDGYIASDYLILVQ